MKTLEHPVASILCQLVTVRVRQLRLIRSISSNSLRELREFASNYAVHSLGNIRERYI